ncbi:MAG: hypothetical protein AAF989_13515 [Planctomycetota bacterium]
MTKHSAANDSAGLRPANRLGSDDELSTTDTAATRGASRRLFYSLVVSIGLAISAGQIATVTSREGTTAFLSANDRSRWCTIAALVEDGTFAIDRQMKLVDEKGRRHWQSIDRVQHRGEDGRRHDYSSKPPLFPVMVSWLYWGARQATGMTLTEQPVYLTRCLLALVNLPLLAVFFLATIGCVEKMGIGDLGKRFSAVATCLGTMLLPFSVSLNNHLPAASATALTTWLFLVLAERRRTAVGTTKTEKAKNMSADDKAVPAPSAKPLSGWSDAVFLGLAGVSAGFVAANELPGLSMVGLWWLLFAWLGWRSWLFYSLGVATVLVAFLSTNWIAHQSLRPPYAHRGVGELVTEADFAVADVPLDELSGQLRSAGAMSRDESLTQWVPSDEPGRLRLESDRGRWFAALPTSKQAGDVISTEDAENRAGDLNRTSSQRWQIRHWDDWYEYPGSYWQTERRGVDRGEHDRRRYLFHSTIGHHGLFSLTPVWLLFPFGLWMSRRSFLETRLLMASVAVASIVCFAFYMARPEIDRNYGGVSVCFRWMLWFAPLWLVASSLCFDWLARHSKLRIFAVVVLAYSVFSMATSLSNPWQSPWLYRYWEFLGWIGG